MELKQCKKQTTPKDMGKKSLQNANAPKRYCQNTPCLQDIRKLEPRKGQMMISETRNVKVRCIKEVWKLLSKIRISFFIWIALVQQSKFTCLMFSTYNCEWKMKLMKKILLGCPKFWSPLKECQMKMGF